MNRSPLSACSMRVPMALLGALLVGCAAELPDPGATGPEVRPPALTPTLGTADVPVDTTPDVVDDAEDTAGDQDLVPDGADVGSDVDLDVPPAVPVSCLDVLQRDDTAVSGRFTIDPDGDGGQAPVLVHCDMELDGGGWTLVGRTDNEGTAAAFGWTSSHGGVDDYRQPYSLGAVALGLAFTQVALGSRQDVELWENVYLFDLPDEFVTACATEGCPVTRVGARGYCVGLLDDQPARLQTMGFVEATDRFHIAPTTSAPDQGLYGNGPWFEDAPPDCVDNGGIAGKIAMIMVR